MAQRIIECAHCHRQRYESRMKMILGDTGLCRGKGTCKIKAKEWRQEQRDLGLPAPSYYKQYQVENDWTKLRKDP